MRIRRLDPRTTPNSLLRRYAIILLLELTNWKDVGENSGSNLLSVVWYFLAGKAPSRYHRNSTE